MQSSRIFFLYINDVPLVKSIIYLLEIMRFHSKIEIFSGDCFVFINLGKNVKRRELKITSLLKENMHFYI